MASHSPVCSLAWPLRNRHLSREWRSPSTFTINKSVLSGKLTGDGKKNQHFTIGDTSSFWVCFPAIAMLVYRSVTSKRCFRSTIGSVVSFLGFCDFRPHVIEYNGKPATRTYIWGKHIIPYKYQLPNNANENPKGWWIDTLSRNHFAPIGRSMVNICRSIVYKFYINGLISFIPFSLHQSCSQHQLIDFHPTSGYPLPRWKYTEDGVASPSGAACRSGGKHSSVQS